MNHTHRPMHTGRHPLFASLVATALMLAIAPRLAAQAAVASPSGDIPEESAVVLEKYEVTSQRVDGLINKSLLQGGEDAPVHQDIVTRLDIERMGVTSVEELMRNLTQTTGRHDGTILQSAPDGLATSGGGVIKYSTVGLRGFDSAETVVLINGRALPRSGSTKTGGADLSRIPLAAIERIEVLPSAASAIYGAGAISGGINIVLRRDYHGRDLTVYYGSSSNGGASERRINYVEGISFGRGRGNMTLTLNYQNRSPLYARDRDYLDEMWRRYGPDTTITTSTGISAFEEFALKAFGANMVVEPSTNPATTLGIPGAASARYAAIPAGLTPVQAQTLTPADFTPTAGVFNKGEGFGRAVIYTPTNIFSTNMQVEYDFIPKVLRGYGEFTYGRTRQDYDSSTLASVTLQAANPVNPFGKAVTLYLDTPDIPAANNKARYDSFRAVAGVRGWIGKNWEWSADLTVDYSDNRLSSTDPLYALRDVISPEAVAAYNVFADHTLHPISQALVDKYFSFARSSSNRTTLLEGNVRVTGDVFELPAGPLRTSLVGRYSNWEYAHALAFDGADYFANPGYFTSSSGDDTRKTWQGGLEVVIPVIGKKWRPLPLDALDFNLSASWESNKSGGTTLTSSNSVNARTYVAAVKLQATKDIALRASYSEGFYPPDWGVLARTVTTLPVPGFPNDPMRGNTPQWDLSIGDMAFIDVTEGGNPDLRPETTNSHNYGIIITPRFIPGLTLSIDYWKTKKKDGLAYINWMNIVAHADIYASHITRAAPTAADTAKGWLGKITAIDTREFNAKRIETDGIDFKLRYLRATKRWGTFDWVTSLTYTNEFVIKADPTTPDDNTLGTVRGPLRWRGNSGITWAMKRWTNSLTARYTHTYQSDETSPYSYLYDGKLMPSVLTWDYQISYSIPYKVTDWRNERTWFAGTTWTIGALNVLNRKPAFETNGRTYYNRYDDPRQMFIYAQVKKSF